MYLFPVEFLTIPLDKICIIHCRSSTFVWRMSPIWRSPSVFRLRRDVNLSWSATCTTGMHISQFTSLMNIYNHILIFLSKLLASLMRSYFPKCTSGASLHILSKLYDVPDGFYLLPLLGSVLLNLRLPKGGCCSLSDDLSFLFTWECTIISFL